MKGNKYAVLLLAVLLALPVAVRGQCDPMPLPYTSDLRTGFHTPHTYNPVGVSSMTGWSLGANYDNCWIGYLWQSEDEPLGLLVQGNFGVGGEWPTWTYYCTFSVPDSLHQGVAMLVAPEVEGVLTSIGLTMQLLKEQHVDQPVCTNYCAYLDYGWVRDAGRPMETFDMVGTLCIYTRDGNGNVDHNLSADWPYYCFPVTDSLPAGSRFALRMRSALQAWPHPNGIYESGWPYTFCIKEFEASNIVCNPALTSDTVYLTDSVCQYSLYTGYGIALSATQTADTGRRTYTLSDFEYLEDGNCHEHVRLLTLTVLPSDISIVRDSIFPGDAYLFGGQELTLAGGYVDDHGLNAYGCPIKDSLELSIRTLPPLECDAEIGVERLDWYISQPTEVQLWAVNEADSYRWTPSELFADDTARNVRFMLQPESEQWVRLEVERFDTVNHIHRGAEMDTTAQQLQLTVPVEPQTRYRFAMTLGDGDDVTAQVFVDGTSLFGGVVSAGRLEAEFNAAQRSEVTLKVVANQPVRMTETGLWRYCRAVDLVTLVARSLCPVIVADRTLICLGDSVTLRAGQTDYYRWVSQPADASLEEQQGRASVTVGPQETTTYYLLTPGGEVADSVVMVVENNPVLQVVADREVVDFDHPVLTLEEMSAVADVRWTFSDGGEAEGQKVQWHFGEVTADSLWVREEGCTANGCCSDTLLMFPVEIVSVWFPNVFTPGEATNNRFAMVTNQTVEAYEMTIYNREGLLVATLTDVASGWDGTDLHGKACPQGAYAYLCEYRLAGKPAKRYLGTVLLLR